MQKMGVDHTTEYTRIIGGITPLTREAKSEYTKQTN